MSKRNSVWFVGVLCGALLAAPSAKSLVSDEEIGFERTPPRLGFVDGEVSFWRPGAGDWTPAQVNTALAAGDELYTGGAANLELQVGAAAFVRAGENTQLGLTSLEPDFLQLRVTEGHVSLDLRNRKTSQTIEIDTPNAAFTVEHTGYYRVEVEGETTTFTSRRGGRATVTTAAGAPAAVAPSEQVVVTGTDAPGVETYAAAELDAWDRWNYERTDDQLDAVSARYVPSGVYGVDNLDHSGDWRVVPTYGAVWVPRGVPVGWAPYSTGRWMYDPYYDWTWVDDAPWGWAPYHYGRWVHVSGYWGWCPGRVVVRPYYAPALVAFYGGGGFSIGVSIGTPNFGWVALGWGEPLVPWWGPVGFRGAPRWGGWGGPRVVNNVVINQKTVINVRDINHYQNARVRDAIVAVDRDHFGRRSGGERRFERADASRFKPIHGDLGVKPDRTSLVAGTGTARRPSREVRERSVVAVREPRLDRTPELGSPRSARSSQQRSREERAEARTETPPTRVVRQEGGRIEASQRPPFGRSGERERRISPPAPRFEEVQRQEEARGRRERSREAAATRTRAPEAPAAPEAVREPRSRRERTREAAATRTATPEAPAAPEVVREPRSRRERSAASPSERPQSAAPERPSPARQEPGGELRSPRVGERRERGTPRREPEQASPAPQQIPREPARERGQASPAPQQLPGEPANRVYPQRSGRMSRAQQIAPQEMEAARGAEPRSGDPAGGREMRGAQSRSGGGGGGREIPGAQGGARSAGGGAQPRGGRGPQGHR